MKNLKGLLLAAVCALVSLPAGAQTVNQPYLNITGTNKITGTSLISPVTSDQAYSTAITGNPLLQHNYANTLVSTSLSSTALTTLIASTAGRTIHVADVSIMVSGTAASATALAVECGDGTLIAQWPIADLVSLKPIGTGLYLSTLSTITTGAGLGSGCPASYGVYLSNVGTKITTTTNVYTNVLYSVQ